MKEYHSEQTINPAVDTIRFTRDEMIEIIVKHLQETRPLQAVDKIEFWYQEEPMRPFAHNIDADPWAGYTLTITHKIK